MLLVEIFIIGVGLGKLKFYQIFVWDWFLLMICFGIWPIVANRTCIRVVFMMFMHCFTLLFIVCTLGV